MIELPEFMTGALVERTYGRIKALRALPRGHSRAVRYVQQGLRRAKARDPRLLLFLEKGADYLQHRNDEQQSRLEQSGYQRQEFGEYSQWREAYRRADAPQQSEVHLQVYQWIYAAIAEALDT